MKQADYRDVMMALAAYHVSAQRLGLEPAPFFDEAATFAVPDIAHTFHIFGRRKDVTPGAFALRLIETPYGLRYRQS